MNIAEYLKNDGVRGLLLARLQREIADTIVANFALDEIGGALEGDNAALRQQVANLVEKTTADHALIAALREQVMTLTAEAGRPVPKSARKA